VHFYCLHALTQLWRRRHSSQQCYLHPLQEIKPIACARMELRRIMLAVLLQFMNAFTAVLKQCFPAYSLCHLSLVTDRQKSVLEV